MADLKSLALKIAKSPAVRKAAIGLAVAIAAALGLGNLGCHDLTPKQQAQLDKFECQVEALKLIVEPALDAADLLKDLYAGKAQLGAVLGALGAQEPEVRELVARLRACDPPAPLEAEPASW